MQSDPEAAEILFATERLILAYLYGEEFTEPEEKPQHIEEAQLLLRVALNLEPPGV